MQILDKFVALRIEIMIYQKRTICYVWQSKFSNMFILTIPRNKYSIKSFLNCESIELIRRV